MGWLAGFYFPAYPGEDDWLTTHDEMVAMAGMRVLVKAHTAVNRAHVFRNFDHFAGRCSLRKSPDMTFCISHWLPLHGSEARPPEVVLAVPCGHCPIRLSSKGDLKEHMRKAHKDILERQRLEYMAKRSAKDG